MTQTLGPTGWHIESIGDSLAVLCGTRPGILGVMPQHALPEGTVSFVFSDVEGSTRLLERDPLGLGQALARHHELLAGAVDEHGGVVFETVGDAVYAAFEAAGPAVAAAVAMQRALAAQDWGSLGELRIRIAVHSGAVERRGEHYFGPPLFTCARLQVLAHGQQTVCSGATAALLTHDMPLGLHLRPLGRHRLKDLAEPIEVVQVDGPGLRDTFPALRSAGLVPTNLRPVASAFIGRQRELAELHELVLAHRLVTVLGPGGTGKTRLCLEAAAGLRERFPDGVFLVELGQLDEGALVPDAVADALSLRPSPGQGAMAALTAHLGSLEVLLVLDNWEQLLPGGRVVAELLAAAPGLHILATSRIPLRLGGEQRYRLAPLTTPSATRSADGAPDMEALLASDAVRLFAERARAADSAFAVDAANAADVAALCRRLDGLPLALELAAARMDVLDPRTVLRGLDAGRDVLAAAADAPDRQRSLEGVIDWSVRLLPPELAAVFRQLSVFAGPFTAEAAQAVVSLHGDGAAGPPFDTVTVLAALADASLLVSRRDPMGGTRFLMLETIAAFAAAQLAAHGAEEAARDRHAAWVADFAEAYEQGIDSAEAVEWAQRMDDAVDDSLRALEWCVGRTQGDIAARILGCTWRMWNGSANPREIAVWAARVLALPLADRWRGKVLNLLGILQLWVQGGLKDGLAYFEEALALLRRQGTPAEVADATNNVGVQLFLLEDVVGAEERFRASIDLWRATGESRGEAIATSNLADLMRHGGDLEAASVIIERAVSLAEASGNPNAIVSCQIARLQINVQRGSVGVDPDAARAVREEMRAALRLAGRIRDQYSGSWLLVIMASFESGASDADAVRAARLLGIAEHAAGWARQEPAAATMLAKARAGCTATLGSALFEAAYQDGHALTREAAVGYTLGDADPFAIAAS